MKRILAILLMATLVLSLCGALALADEEIVDGKFTTTRKITVEIYDRSNDGGSKPEDNVYTDFIKEGMLRDHNVEVEFVTVPRWGEDSAINNLLASGEAPDVCVTYNYPAVLSYAGMGGIINLTPLLEQHKDLLPNMWELLGDRNIYWNQDPETKDLWAIEAILNNSARINTFIREDWLQKLNLPAPTSKQEFEDMLVAFRDNAELLLGADADKMIPFSTSYDVGWRADHITASFVPSTATDRELYIKGYDDRHIFYPNYKEGIRLLNKWYNMDLIWKDFPLYGEGDTTEDNLIKAGYVGAFIHNWDYPFRNGEDSIHANLKRNVGEEAGYIAVNCFENDAGKYLRFLSNPIDRKVFLPITNDEPLASLLYIDFISTYENYNFLQIGEQGVTHEVMDNGAIKTLAVQGEKIMNSGNNIDYTITQNGLHLADPEITAKSMALGYASVESRYVEIAFAASTVDGRVVQNFNCGVIAAEEGMQSIIKTKRDAMLCQSIVASPEQFDAIYDSGMDDILASGAQEIIDERTKMLEKFYGAE